MAIQVYIPITNLLCSMNHLFNNWIKCVCIQIAQSTNDVIPTLKPLFWLDQLPKITLTFMSLEEIWGVQEPTSSLALGTLQTGLLQRQRSSPTWSRPCHVIFKEKKSSYFCILRIIFFLNFFSNSQMFLHCGRNNDGNKPKTGSWTPQILSNELAVFRRYRQ